MGNSRRRGPFNPPFGLVLIPARTCGPLGYNDQGDPTRTTLLGDTPGSLGWFDHADQSLPLAAPLRLTMTMRLRDGTPLSLGDGKEAVVTSASGTSRKLTREQLKKIFPLADETYLQQVADELNTDLPKYGLDTVLRLSHFFAQVREEAGARLQGRVENLNYSAADLVKTFGYYKKNPKEAETDGYVRDPKTKKLVHGSDQETIANKAYGGRMGNGNAESGDGWRYRGRGFFQLTGKNQYTAMNEQYKTYYDATSANFVTNPELVEQFPYTIRSAICYWNGNRLPKIADRGSAGENVDEVTKVINKATKSYGERRKHFEKIHAIFK